MQDNNISRRTLVATAAAGAVAAGATMAANALAKEAVSAKAEGAQADYLLEMWDYETDVLVIGYGGAGIWAAVTAADEGKSEVLILEKAPVRGGGNSSINLGEFTVPKDPEGCAQYIEAFSGGLTPKAMAETWANEAVHNGEYCDKWGIPWTLNEGTLASGYKSSCEYPFLPGSDSMAIGAIEGYGMNFWDVMDKNRQDLGIDVLFGCENEELIQNPDTKEILGAYSDYDGKRIAIKARKGVIMTIGGFEFNEDLKNEYLKVFPALGFYGWPYNTGDGIQMVQKVGAQLWHMNCMIGGANPNFHDPEYPFAIQLHPKGNSYIYTDRIGKRWTAEDTSRSPHVGWHAYCEFDDSICGFSHAPTWCILDQAVIDAGRMGPDPTAPLARGMYTPTLPKELGRYDGWSEDNQIEIEKGWILKGDTLEELVDKIHEIDPDLMDIETLRQTIEIYNGYCETGEDKDLGRDPGSMVALSLDGPFYAYPIYPGGCSTLGGPKKNENAEVLDVTDKVIPRLYAAGCFGNFAANTYGISGGNNAENMVWGRIAGRRAGALEPWDE